MTNKLFLIVGLILFSIGVYAQENQEENGLKVGSWVHKDKRGLVFAKGTYRNNRRVGQWSFYVSALARFTQVPDVTGHYNSAGMKDEKWVFVDSKTKLKIIANFANNLMEGECRYYSPEGGLLARGLMNAGIRHGKWIFYYNNQKMTEGFYQNGIKINKWIYDYFPEKTLHVKGAYTYNNGVKSGRMEYYRVENHPIFGNEELLSGVGTYTNGRKTGRWIEFSLGLKGKLVQTGSYTRGGQRYGHWKTTLGGKNYELASYNNGKLEGVFKQYYNNGRIKYSTTYKDGLEVGKFTRYYSNGYKKEEGFFQLAANTDEAKRDTTYFILKLPLEYHFDLVELDFPNLEYHYISWIKEAGWSIHPVELDRRFELYKDYGKEPHRRYTSIAIGDKSGVLSGDYQSFHPNGKLKMIGKYYPIVTEVFDPETNTIIKDFARDGEWKKYDDNGYLMRTFYYKRGKLIKMLDDKGHVMGINDDDTKG